MDVDASYRLRGALLAGVGIVALTFGGWWWQAAAPAGARLGMMPDSLSVPSWQEESGGRGMSGQESETSSLGVIDMARRGVLIDARTGQVVGSSAESDPGRGAGRDGGRPTVVWSERASLSASTALARESRLARDERNLLIFSCTGPGELLVTVVGARAADPLTVGCDGTTITTEMTGTGANVTVLFSTVNTDALHLVARLIDPS